MKPKLKSPDPRADPRFTFRAYDILLLNLSSKCLRRRIKLIPLMGGDEIIIPADDEPKSMIFPPVKTADTL